MPDGWFARTRRTPSLPQFGVNADGFTHLPPYPGWFVTLPDRTAALIPVQFPVQLILLTRRRIPAIPPLEDYPQLHTTTGYYHIYCYPRC